MPLVPLLAGAADFGRRHANPACAGRLTPRATRCFLAYPVHFNRFAAYRECADETMFRTLGREG